MGMLSRANLSQVNRSHSCQAINMPQAMSEAETHAVRGGKITLFVNSLPSSTQASVPAPANQPGMLPPNRGGKNQFKMPNEPPPEPQPSENCAADRCTSDG